MESFDSDFLGKPPGWLTRIGITLLGVLFVIIFVASFFIRYNDVLQSEVEVTPVAPPILIKAKYTGRISEFFVNPGDDVVIGDSIAKFQTVENYSDIQAVESAVSARTIPEKLGFPKPTSLGALKDSYSDYLKAYYEIRTVEKFYGSDIAELVGGQSRKSKTTNFADTYNKLQAAKRNNALVKQNHKRMETLFEKGVISKAELDESQFELNKSLSDISGLSDDYYKDSYKTSQQFEGHISDIEIASLKVLSEIEIWKDKNVMTSPVNGKIFFMEVWSPYQSVTIDQELFGISPKSGGSLMGIAKIPIHNSGKVQLGQKAIVKLYGFPYEEWGALEGSLTGISASPSRSGDAHYLAYIKMDSTKNDLSTSVMNKGSSLGSCNIILQESSLFNKLFIGIKGIFNSN